MTRQKIILPAAGAAAAAVICAYAAWHVSPSPHAASQSAEYHGTVRLPGSFPGLENFVSGATPADFAKALASLKDDDVAREDIIRQWAARDPAAAAAWVLKMEEGPERDEALAVVAIAWTGRDLPGAIAWARGLSFDTEKTACLTNIAYEASRSHPAEALQVAVTLPAGQGTNDLVTHAIAQWAAVDPASATAWARQIPDQEFSARLVSAVAAAQAKDHPQAAAEMAISAIPAGPWQDNAVVSIVQQWAKQDPAAAAAWITKFPEGALRRTAMENLAQLWAGRDITQAAGWLGNLPDSPSRDSALAACAGRIALSSPDTAEAWAASIASEPLRNGLMESVASRWLARDPAQARHWITQSALPDETKARLLAGNPVAQ